MLIVRPLVRLFLLLRTAWHWVWRVLVCEPFFKAHCSSFGTHVHTGVFLHWITGDGDLIVGDEVLLDGKSSISFAARFSNRPTLVIGDRSFVAHGVEIVVARRVEIGSDCYIASRARIADSNGHPLSPARRLSKLPPEPSEVRPVRIGNNVWIGTGAFILPGVTIGDGSVVAAGAVVTADVAPATLVGGIPARQIKSLTD